MENINKSEIDRISFCLRKFTFVAWDRFTADEKDIRIYGWIDREQDAYKDFVLLTFSRVNDFLRFDTSSSKYSSKISDILFGDHGTHDECVRVEDVFNVKNCVELGGGKHE